MPQGGAQVAKDARHLIPHRRWFPRIFAAMVTAALCSTSFANVVINELMYHPPNDNEAREFVEIHNTGASAVSLTGWCVEGIDYSSRRTPPNSRPPTGFLPTLFTPASLATAVSALRLRTLPPSSRMRLSTPTWASGRQRPTARDPPWKESIRHLAATPLETGARASQVPATRPTRSTASTPSAFPLGSARSLTQLIRPPWR